MDQLFSILPEKARTQLKGLMLDRKVKAGENVFIQGEPSRAIYFVTKGRIKISRVTKEGYENVLCVRGPGDIFCPLPVLDGGNQLGTAIALTDVVLSWVEQAAFLDLCKQFPELLAYVQGDCLFEVRHLVSRMEASAFRNLRERLAFILLDILERQTAYGGPGTELHLKQQELAGLVGTSRESISRTLSYLEEKGVLTTYRGRLVIHDIEKLRILAG